MAKADLLRIAKKSLPLLIFLAGMLPVLLHLGTCGLLETSEGRYASVARQMLDSDDWFTPRQNGLKHLTKPPVTYWLSATGMQLFGINEFGARFFLSFAAGLTALGTYLLGKLLFDRMTGLLAAIILVTSIFFQAQFRGLTTDPYLAAAETFMVLAFLSFVRKRRRHWELVFWLSAAAAMLTKGPPGLLPLLGLIPAALIMGYKEEVRQLFKSIAGWVIFVFFGLGWYLLIAMTNPGLLSYFLIDETLNRVASTQHQRSAPFYYFFVLLPLGLFPWSSFFLAALKGFICDFRKDVNVTFLLLWIAAPLLVFTLSRSKLAGYALPLLVPIALLTAVALQRLLAGNSDAYSRTWQRHGMLTGLVVAVSATAMMVTGALNYAIYPTLPTIGIYAGLFWFLSAMFITGFLIKKNKMGTFAVMCLLIPGIFFFVLPGVKGNEQYGPNKFLTSHWLLLKRIATLPPGQDIICLEQMIEGWYFYTGRIVKTWNIDRVTRFDNERAGELVLTGDEALKNATNNETILVMREKSLARVGELLNMDLEIITREGNWVVTMPTRKMGR